MACLDETTVLEFVQGRLNDDGIARVEEHLDSCSACRLVVARAADSLEPADKATLVEGPGRPPPSRSGITHRTRTRRPLQNGPSASLARGDAIDRFLILDELGAGGMGVVYTAYDPELDRKVAIKLLRWLPLSEQVAHDTKVRFKREAQAMAKLDHPNVISVYDVGTHEGQVFLAMELVQGWTLRGWLAEAKPDWSACLTVLRQAGAGLAAAHRAGIVHRDFKPDNVLVGRDGRVRVSDFGLARAIQEMDEPPSIAQPDLTPALDSALTRVGAILGTPAYMPPEQRAGLPTDARADQFSFCVTAYEALYGIRPFGNRLDDAPADFAVPAPPADSAVPSWVLPVLSRGLAVDPTARFERMDALLAALEPPRSRRAWWIAASLGSVALAALAATTVLHQRSKAEDTDCRAMTDLRGTWDPERKAAVKRALLATGQPWAEVTWQTTERELDAYAASWRQLSHSTCDSARTGAATAGLVDLRRECLTQRLDELSALTRLLSNADTAVAERAVVAVQGLTPLTHCEDTATLMTHVQPLLDPMKRARVHEARVTLADAAALIEAGKPGEATQLVEGAVAAARSIDYKPLVAEALLYHGAILVDTGHPAEAVAVLREASHAAIEGRDDKTATVCYTLQSVVLGAHLAKFTEAFAAAETAEAHMGRLGNPADLRRSLLVSLAEIRMMQGNLDEAGKAYEDALALYDERDVNRAEALEGLGDVWFLQGKLDAAEDAFRRANKLRASALGAEHPYMASSHENIASIFWARGQYERAIAEFEQARSMTSGPEAVTLAANIGVVMIDMGRNEEALSTMQKTVVDLARIHGDDHPEVARIRLRIAVAHARLGNFREAHELMQRSHDVFVGAQGPESIDVAMVLYEQAEVARIRRRWAEAESLYERSLAIVQATMGKDYRGAGHVLTGQGLTLLAMGRHRDAIAPLRRALELRETDHIGLELRAETRFALAQALHAAGEPREARALAEKARSEYTEASIVDKAAKCAAIDAWLTRHR